MKVLVLGAGVIGVTAAYELAGAGHEVTVVDRPARPGDGDELRQRRRGIAGYSAPWAGRACR
jgi:D-amino-acid dehydrogenase